MQRPALRLSHAVRMPDSLNLPALLFATALVGYPIAGLTAVLLGLPSRMTSVPFRLFVLILALIVSFRGIWSVRFRPGVLLIFLFWGFYAIRLYIDMAVVQLEGADYALEFFLVACVAPALALVASDRGLSNVALARATLWVGGIACTAFIVYYVVGGGRTDPTNLTGRFSIETVNSITIGYLGAGCLTAALYLWSRSRFLLHRVRLIFSIVVSVTCLVLPASKGPVLALVACFLFWALKRRKYSLLLAFAFCLMILGIYLAGTSLGTRFLMIQKDPSTAERLILLRDSYEQITGSPILGSAYVELKSRTYPHNIFVGAALSVGLPMAIVLAGLTCVALLRAWNAIGKGGTLISLFFIQSLVNSVISGSLFTATSFWMTTVILLNHPSWAANGNFVEWIADWVVASRTIILRPRSTPAQRIRL